MNEQTIAAIKKAKWLKPRAQDVYKLAGAPREIKRINNYGEEVWGYVYSPELFVKSAATGRMCRFFLEVDGVTFHPDELAAAKEQADGTIKILTNESLTVDDPLNGRKKNFRSLDKALYDICGIIPKKGSTIDDDICTITNKKTDRSFTMSRAEWREVNKTELRLSRNRWEVQTSFSEMAERLS